jgi:hypothetical protein
MTAPQLDSVLTCPRCGDAQTLLLPTDACRFSQECSAGNVLLRPLAALVAGVVVLHSLASNVGIGAGTVALFVATIWNARLPVACDSR